MYCKSLHSKVILIFLIFIAHRCLSADNIYTQSFVIWDNSSVIVILIFHSKVYAATITEIRAMTSWLKEGISSLTILKNSEIFIEYLRREGKTDNLKLNNGNN